MFCPLVSIISWFPSSLKNVLQRVFSHAQHDSLHDIIRNETFTNGVTSGSCILSSPASLAASLHPSKTSVKLSTACDAPPFRQTQQRMSDFHHLECWRCIGWPTLYIYNGGHDEHTYTRQQKECEGTCDALLQPLRKRFPKGTAHLSKDFCFCTWIALLENTGKLLFSLRILLGHYCFMVSRCA